MEIKIENNTVKLNGETFGKVQEIEYKKERIKIFTPYEYYRNTVTADTLIEVANAINSHSFAVAKAE